MGPKERGILLLLFNELFSISSLQLMHKQELYTSYVFCHCFTTMFVYRALLTDWIRNKNKVKKKRAEKNTHIKLILDHKIRNTQIIRIHSYMYILCTWSSLSTPPIRIKAWRIFIYLYFFFRSYCYYSWVRCLVFGMEMNARANSKTNAFQAH